MIIVNVGAKDSQLPKGMVLLGPSFGTFFGSLIASLVLVFFLRGRLVGLTGGPGGVRCE
jgi:hypothetical protein